MVPELRKDGKIFNVLSNLTPIIKYESVEYKKAI